MTIDDIPRKRRLLDWFDAHPELLARLSEHDQLRLETMRKTEKSCMLIVCWMQPAEHPEWQGWCAGWPYLSNDSTPVPERERADLA
jgi:hypothetical protein